MVGNHDIRFVLRTAFDIADHAVYGPGSPPRHDSDYRDRSDEDKEDDREEWCDTKAERWGEATPASPVLAGLWPVAKKVVYRGGWTDRGYSFDQFEREAAPVLRQMIRDRIAARQGPSQGDRPLNR